MRSLVWLRRDILKLLFQISACEDELEQKWNTFAHAANEYIHTRDANQASRLRAKEHLEELWRGVYDLACF